MAEDLGQKMIFRYRSGWIFAYVIYFSLFTTLWSVMSFGIKSASGTPTPKAFAYIGLTLIVITAVMICRILFEHVEISGGSIKWFNWIGMEKIHVGSTDILRLEETSRRYMTDRYVYPIYVLTTKGEFKFWSGITDGDELIAYLRECVEKRIEMNL